MEIEEPDQRPIMADIPSQVSSRTIIIAIGIFTVVSLTALIIGAVALTQRNTVEEIITTDGSNPFFPSTTGKTSGGTGSGTGNNGYPIVITTGGQTISTGDAKIWRLALGHDYGAYSYVDKEGYIRGLSADMITAVCAEAGVDCRAVYDSYQNCWVSEPGQHSHGGQGLLGGWYDACVGWAPTLDRIHVFDFSVPFAKKERTSLYVRKDSSSDITHYNNKTIGFVQGFAADEKCFAEKYLLPKNKIKYARTPGLLVLLLNERRVDAIFAEDVAMAPYRSQLKQINSDTFECTLDGLSVMAQKGSPILSIWNNGFLKLRSSGQLQTICKKATEKHNAYSEGAECIIS